MGELGERALVAARSSGRSTSRTAASSTARNARPGAKCSPTGGFRGCSNDLARREGRGRVSEQARGLGRSRAAKEPPRRPVQGPASARPDDRAAGASPADVAPPSRRSGRGVSPTTTATQAPARSDASAPQVQVREAQALPAGEDIVHRGVPWRRSRRGQLFWYNEGLGGWVLWERGQDAPPLPPAWAPRASDAGLAAGKGGDGRKPPRPAGGLRSDAMVRRRPMTSPYRLAPLLIALAN